MNRLNVAPRFSAANGSQRGGSVQRNSGGFDLGIHFQPDGGREILCVGQDKQRRVVQREQFAG